MREFSGRDSTFWKLWFQNFFTVTTWGFSLKEMRLFYIFSTEYFLSVDNNICKWMSTAFAEPFPKPSPQGFSNPTHFKHRNTGSERHSSSHQGEMLRQKHGMSWPNRNSTLQLTPLCAKSLRRSALVDAILRSFWGTWFTLSSSVLLHLRLVFYTSLYLPLNKA